MRTCLLLLAALLLTVTACAPVGPTVERDRVYPRSYAFYDLKVSWETARDAGGITVNGTVKNTSFYYLRDLELTAGPMDAGGKVLAEETFFFFPNLLSLDETAPFTIRVPLKEGESPVRIRFIYRYRLAEEGKHGSPRFHSFEGAL